MVTVIVLAAGVGSRMQSDTAKQFLKIGEHEVLSYSLRTFQAHPDVDAIVLVTKEAFIEHCRTDIVEKYGLSKVKAICCGGKERYDSVYNGLCAVEEDMQEQDLVMIHDGARPFVTEKMITDSIQCAKQYEACTVAVPVKDTIKRIDADGFGVETPDRSYLYQIQTPQTFRYGLLLESYHRMYEEQKTDTGNCRITDDTMLVEQYGNVRCKLVDGAYENIKITTPEDLEIAEILLGRYPS